MKKNYPLLFISLLLVQLSTAQYEEKVSTTDVLRVNVLAPGISFEKSTFSNQTLYAQLYATLGLYFTYSSSLGTDAGITVDPALSAQYRFYYNLTQRAERGKRTFMNSGEYIGPAYQASYSKNPLNESDLEEENRRLINMIGAVWGLQRNYQRRFSIDANIGPALLFARTTVYDVYGSRVQEQEIRFTIISKLSLGIWLNRRK